MIKFKLYNKKGFTPLEILKNKLLTEQDTNKRSKFLMGFTLIELMVAMGIFVVVSMVSVSIFLTAIQNQRRDFQVQNLQDNARYLIETMTKEIRMSQTIEDPPDTKENDILRMVNQDNNDVRYKFESDSLTRIEKTSGKVGNGEPGNPISSSEVKINGKFYVVNESNKQPRVTIIMTLSPANATEPKITVQNTVTIRFY